MKESDNYSDAETQRRLDKALKRSLQMPPPQDAKKPTRARKVKRATSKKRAPSA